MNLKKTLTLLLLSIFSWIPVSAQQAAGAQDFRAGKGHFELNGKPFLIRAAELHYPRIPKKYWENRIRLCKAMGMNTICIYIFWNLHEQRENQYDFTGQNDVAEFVRLVQKNGMYCMVRPGPYVCAEWDMGGLPWWLLKKKDLQVRTGKDAVYMSGLKRYMKKVGEQLAPLQIQNGGNIIMVQVENEYGTWGDDSQYMASVRDVVRSSGFDKVQLFRCDWSSNFDRYQLPGVAGTLNFGAGSNIDEQFKKFRQVNPDAPLMCSEYWTGWFDQWGRPHETRGVDTFIGSLKDMMDRGISFSLYMAHGGTSFGQWAGGNAPPYAPTVTSYDYDAPIDETGKPTDKFFAIRNLLKNYLNPGETIPEIPKPVSEMQVFPEVKMKGFASVFDNLPKPVASEHPVTMEFLDQGWGSILYRKTIPPTGKKSVLHIEDAHDYALVFLNKQYIGKLDRRLNEKTIELPSFSKAAQLDILVETTGRVNYGQAVIDRKGINGNVNIETDGRKELLKNWNIYTFPIDLAAENRLKYKNDAASGPGWYRSDIHINRVGDTFINLTGWTKGMVWVNGHNLGHYWNIGPTQTLFVPGTFLKEGNNEIIVYDVAAKDNRSLSFTDKPVYEIIADPSLLHNRGGDQPDFTGMKPVATGNFAHEPGWKKISFEPQNARYIALVALNAQDSKDLSASLAEIEVTGKNGKAIDPQKWKVVYADSEEVITANNSADKLFDNQESVIWQTSLSHPASYPHTVIIDLGEEAGVNGFGALPRIDKSKKGIIKDFRLYLSRKPFNFSKK
jgi:beta-galactosidase